MRSRDARVQQVSVENCSQAVISGQHTDTRQHVQLLHARAVHAHTVARTVCSRQGARMEVASALRGLSLRTAVRMCVMLSVCASTACKRSHTPPLRCSSKPIICRLYSHAFDCMSCGCDYEIARCNQQRFAAPHAAPLQAQAGQPLSMPQLLVACSAGGV